MRRSQRAVFIARGFMNEVKSQLYDAAASRAIDACAIADSGVSGYALMQRAAEAAFACLLQSFPGVKSVTVCCGKGNNAGDAYLVALRAHQLGIHTQVFALVAPADLQGDGERAYLDASAGGVAVSVAQSADDITPTGEVIIDGLLGTGIEGAPRQPFASCIEKLNTSGRKILSIDLPSGVNADTGAVAGAAVRADVTLSFITRKIGLYTGDGVSHAGLRLYDDLGVPDEMYTSPGVPQLFWDAGVLPGLDANTYKHRQGHVVVAGGDTSMPGAVSMAAQAALRVGAGMVTVITQPQHATAIVARTPEVMVVPAQTPRAQEVIAACSLVVLGPGLGRSDWSEALYDLVEQSDKPTVLDADGLFWLARRGAWQGGPLVITPHVAEAARLLNCPAAEVQQDRLSACQALHGQYGCHGVLKGAGSVVFDGAQLAVCAHGNPGMATAGMGDVLSGIVAGLLAAAPQQTAACLSAAVALHSAAADEAVLETGERSLIATDVIAQLPGLLHSG